MVFNYPDDVNTYNIDDQYFFGENMLVCPVTEKGAKSRTLYLPEGNWIDYWSGEKFAGTQNIITKTPLEKLPVYVKAGSIIPMQPDMQYFGEKPINPVTLDIFPSGKSAYKLYEDDGLSLDYQKGVFAQTDISCIENSQSVNVEILATTGKYKVANRNYTLWVHLDKKPASVNSGDVLLDDWKFDTDKKILEFTIAKKAAEKISVRITR
jgi:alpha-glucosidase (family GH31 glycosyl hydrolase)